MEIIKYQFVEKSLKIFSKAKNLPSNFKKWFLLEAIKIFDLYERLGENIELLNKYDIEKSTDLDSFTVFELKKSYKIEKDINLSFDEFLDFNKVVFADIYVFPKNTPIDQKDISNNKNLLAIIDLQPDGDSDSIWIEFFTEESFFIKLVDEYNNKEKCPFEDGNI